MSAAPATKATRHILVLGTLAFETALIPEKASGNANLRQAAAHAYSKKDNWVGAPIIREMISEALETRPTQTSAAPASTRIHPDHAPAVGVRAECVELTTIFAQFPRTPSQKKDDLAWRVKQNYRVRPDSSGDAEYTAYWQRCLTAHPAPSIVAVYLQDEKFRHCLRSLSVSHSTPALIVALADEIDRTSIEAARALFKPQQTIVLVTADALRRKGVNLVSYGSIERTVTELSARLLMPPVTDIFDSTCSHLVVLFEETGAVCVTRTRKGLKGSIHFCPNFDRVAQMDEDTYGRTPGRMAITLTAVTRSVDTWLEERSALPGTPLDLAPALRLAVVAYNKMFSTGFDERNPFSTVKAALSPDERVKLESILGPTKPQEEFLLSSISFPTDVASLKAWSRLKDVKAGGDIALTIVQQGVEAACRDYTATGSGSGASWWPGRQITCPFMQVGKIQTFDRDEIEQYADLAKLMRKYLADEHWSTPLSIAVFGPPGAGKSFAVKQLMKMVNPGIKDSAILTFNLAQFDSLELLTEAFHQVQDQALTSTDVPLVIFDEFDSSFHESRLGWLKYFLAPMEDGVFRGRTTNYKVGRAVFLFAGGTAYSLKDFTRAVTTLGKGRPARGKSGRQPQSKQQLESAKKAADEARAAKLPDFASRLAAHLDVLGINRLDNESGSKAELASFKTRRRVRRATLLRSFLDEFAKGIIRPDKTADVMTEVVNTFLDDDVIYRNEARSMKALVRESRWIGNQFLVASLPSKPLIELHTEHWPFDKLSAIT